MPGQMLFDLALRLGEEREVPAIPQSPRKRADRERARIPKWVEQARPSAKLANPLDTPGEVVLLFPRRLRERRFHARIARSECLPLVERLSADFAHMIHAHQRRRMGALTRVQLGFGLFFRG